MSLTHSRQPLCRLFSGLGVYSSSFVCRYANETPQRSWRRYIRNLSLAALESPNLALKISRKRAETPLNHKVSLHTNPQLYTALPSVQADQSTIQDLQNLSSQQQPQHEEQLPWYLRSRSATTMPSVVEIPPLPEDSPPLLLPILTYLATARSPVFNLSLMDLRALDPSPALGSNLIMILGSARSSQHAHAFSDRFCRWLRSEHRLRPAADGLLGRQQVKIWRRRAAKKVKAMALAGAGPGIEDRIGRDIGLPDWVCVHVGQLPAAIDTNEQVQKVSQEFVGFQRNTDSVTLAVHILTEDRREELDLEGYWDHRIQKMERIIQDDVKGEVFER